MYNYLTTLSNRLQILQVAIITFKSQFKCKSKLQDLSSFKIIKDGNYLQARLGGEDVGDGFRRDLKLISEVQAPFRGFRKFFYVAFTAAAGISLFLTIPRLFVAIKGGEGAPDILTTSQNAAINIGGKTFIQSWNLLVTKKSFFFWMKHN